MHVTNTFASALRVIRGGTALQELVLAGVGLGMATVAVPATAQDYTTGALSGSVVDQLGAPVAGAQVTIRSQQQGDH